MLEIMVLDLQNEKNCLIESKNEVKIQYNALTQDYEDAQELISNLASHLTTPVLSEEMF